MTVHDGVARAIMNDRAAVQMAKATHPLLAAKPPSVAFFLGLVLLPVMIVAILAALPFAYAIQLFAPDGTYPAILFLVVLGYSAEMLLFVYIFWPETVKEIRYHLIAMFSGGFKVPDEDDVHRVKEEEAERNRAEQRVDLERRRDNLAHQINDLRSSLPGIPALPQDPLRYRGYFEEIQDQVQTYVRTRTLEQHTGRLSQYNALIAEALKLEEQIDAMRNISDTRETRHLQRELTKKKTAYQSREVDYDEAVLDDKFEELRQKRQPKPPEESTGAAADMLKVAKNAESLTFAWNYIQVQHADQPEVLAICRAIYQRQMNALKKDRPEV